MFKDFSSLSVMKYLGTIEFPSGVSGFVANRVDSNDVDANDDVQEFELDDLNEDHPGSLVLQPGQRLLLLYCLKDFCCVYLLGFVLVFRKEDQIPIKLSP